MQKCNILHFEQKKRSQDDLNGIQLSCSLLSVELIIGLLCVAITDNGLIQFQGYIYTLLAGNRAVYSYRMHMHNR